jgi:hypothetical protein
MIAHPPINGAYTQLYAGLDKSITRADNGGWSELCFKSLSLEFHTNQIYFVVSPFGKKEAPREDLVENSLGEKYWDWSENQVKLYL